jgi:hypothetical protein
MKKLILTSIVASVLLMSCSDDSNSSSNSELKLFTSSNTTGVVSVTDLKQAMPVVSNFTIASLDTDGVYYSGETDEVILASRTNNTIESYGNLTNAISAGLGNLSVSQSSTSNFNNPREIAVYGDKIVVTQDQNAANGNTNKLVVYQKTSTGITLLNDYTVDFKVWGIHLDGTTLYAVADLTSDLVVFTNFFSNTNGAITPTKRVTIEGLVRTHGITYSASKNMMVLTDVGSATSDSDGGIILISNFSSKINATTNMGTIAMSDQVRIYGASTMLGNPVDVAYDAVTEKIYVAERLNSGGQVLVFDKPTTNGDFAPISSRAEAGISSVFLYRK